MASVLYAETFPFSTKSLHELENTLNIKALIHETFKPNQKEKTLLTHRYVYKTCFWLFLCFIFVILETTVES